MVKPISNDKRAAIVKHMQEGRSTKDTAKWLLVSIRTVERIWKKYKKQGHYQPEPLNCGRKLLVNKTTMNKVVTKIKQQPDITLQELIEEFKLPISQSALCRRLRKLD
ncbi:MAG: helix-turn-helix domain-containing protein [Nitrososphaerota archaeon]|nr:helix-turn-helix domain-containing protein [Nitrososphaerota archaeon]